MKCEVCHHGEAKHIIWIDPEKSPIKVGGRYRVCDGCKKAYEG